MSELAKSGIGAELGSTDVYDWPSESEDERRNRRLAAHRLVDEMLDVFEDSRKENPEPEYERYSNAQYAVTCFWELYEIVLQWAEDFHRGQYRIFKNPDLYKKVSALLERLECSDETWVFQAIGEYFRESRPVVPPLEDAELEDLLYADAQHTINYQEYREVISEMTISKLQADSWVELVRRHSVLAEFGGQSKLFEPPSRKHGDPAQLLEAKREVVSHLCFLNGTGQSKEEARNQVGHEIGLSAHSLKKWEAELSVSSYFRFLFHCAETAGNMKDFLGQFQDAWELDRAVPEDSDLRLENFGSSVLHEAYVQYLKSTFRSCDELRQMVRMAREK